MKFIYVTLLILGIFILPLPSAVAMGDDDNPNFSDYLSSEERKLFIDDEKNKLFNDGQVNISDQEGLNESLEELQEKVNENMQEELNNAALAEDAILDEAEPENVKANKAKTYNYKSRHKSSKELVPRFMEQALTILALNAHPLS